MKNIILITFLFISNICYSQHLDPLELDYTISNQYHTKVILPITIKKDYQIAYFNENRIRSTFYELGNSLLLNYDRDSLNSVSFILQQKINQYNKITTNGNNFGGILLYNRKFGDNTIGVGFYYSKKIYGDYFTPLINIKYYYNKMFIGGVLPSYFCIQYINIGVKWESYNDAFYVDDKYYVRMGDKFWGFQQIKLYYEYNITKNIISYFDIGCYVYGYYKFYTFDNVETNIIKSNKFSSSIGLKYRLK